MKNNSIKYTYIFSFFLLIGLTSCESLLEVDLPINDLSSTTVYTSDATAEAAVNGIYQSMVASTYYSSLHTIPGQTSDELLPVSLIENVYTTNEIPFTDGTIGSMWTELYKTIYNSNAVIEGISGSKTLTEAKSTRFLAEAKFLRAFSYFYLTNLYGDVPLVLTTNVDQSALAPRNTQAEVYNQINLDLEEAANNLPVNYSNYTSNQRIRATKWAAESLLARVNLYLGKWTEASTYASDVISQSGTYKMINGLTATNSPFIADNTEAIWQIPYFNTAYTYEGGATFPGPNPLTQIGGTFILRKSATLFETGDARKTNWTVDIKSSAGVYIGIGPRKYKNSYLTTPVERSTVLRLAELYLIRAEARVKLNNITGAQEDINVIRNRALLGSTTLTDPNQLLDLIAVEREREFFGEFGHRWFDLKRTGKADAVLGIISSKIWNTTDSLYPIPETATRSNPFLTQNEGYTK
ncbi:RagB/SusD family nutrient uptake outer membrane protein [Flavobacterium sp. ANB]|uniref:RagB/SusD family nutrient uptake outer membrane protein n=1 Tax=unclassified Flavobacterium TaxID=196869 RepID=UPI0012B800C5|nr:MULTISPECIES: RagB/SusD family nutrient uptake outer membrane protein [unclassified Flavobacterium]MBF4517857.1 RagB/SusD family nutrient uptake outer membrane protein [Flavobacterium sp. ANB]MTD72073.1 RagB/SusD family nutrient uptake outer membrane protein [Flavobacterium sp. LC2016-13]